jgi:ferredoxin
MTTEYRVRLDRERCDGIFACLVRDDRFVESEDGLATIEGATTSDGETVLTVTDDRQEDAQQAAAACPVDAIDVEVLGDE